MRIFATQKCAKVPDPCWQNAQKCLTPIGILGAKEEALDVYVRTRTDAQLLHYNEPEPGLFVAESIVVIERAMDAGYEAVSFLIEKKQLRYVMDLQGKQLSDLFMMTPYARKTSYKDKAKLGDVEKMNVTASFAVFIYKKIGDGH